MTYLTQNEIESMGFKSVGINVKISDKASIYNTDQIEIGDDSRIDDFCVLSGKISIGQYVHIAPFCLIAGGEKGVTLEDFCGLAYNVMVFSQSDDYSGSSMTNPLIPSKYKLEKKEPVFLRRHVIVGTSSAIMPGVTVEEGCSVGALALVTKTTAPWGVYVGNPARRLKNRKKDLLKMEAEFLKAD